MNTRSKLKEKVKNAETIQLDYCSCCKPSDSEEESEDIGRLIPSPPPRDAYCRHLSEQTPNMPDGTPALTCWECRMKVCYYCCWFNKGNAKGCLHVFDIKGFKDKYLLLCDDCCEYLSYHVERGVKVVPPFNPAEEAN